jgi:predicted AAA+ superfamily ATPase
MIKEVIYEYWRNGPPENKPRQKDIYLTDLVTDIVGIRRCGKTFLMHHKIKELLNSGINKENIIYINFENRKLFPSKPEYFNEIIEFIYAENLFSKGTVYLFLDEVQRIIGWEKFIRSIYDEFKSKLKIVVSGSNSNLLSKDYGSLLTGRHLTRTLFPLSFSEFLEFKGFILPKEILEENISLIKAYLEEYLAYGGFPEVVANNNKEEMLSQLFNDILSRDILTRNVKKEVILEELAYFLASNITSLHSFSKMENYFISRGIKVSSQTLESYFWLIKNSFLFFDTMILSYKIKDMFKNPRKIYCIDNGIANCVGLKFSSNLGKMYENSVFINLMQKNIDRPNYKIHYWKSVLHEEVDFVVKEGEKITKLIQVCYDTADPITKKREMRSLVKAAKELRCCDLFVITKEYNNVENFDYLGEKYKIVFIPLWKWILL